MVSTGVLEYLCEEEQWDQAVKYINDLVERLVSMDNFDQWDVPGVNILDVLFAFSTIGDSLSKLKAPEDEDGIEWCDCSSCDEEDCPMKHHTHDGF